MAGPQGPAGPGGDSGRTVVDALGIEVGIADLTSGLVSRKFGADVVLMPMGPQGIPQSSITFYHTSTNCTGERYLENNGGMFAYFGRYLGGYVFYTRLSDWLYPSLPQPIKSEEVVNIGSDPMALGVCTPKSPRSMSVGAAVAAGDAAFNALVTPFRLR